MTSLLISCVGFHLLPETGADVAAASLSSAIESILTHCHASIQLGAWNPPAEGSLKLPNFLLIPVFLLMAVLTICLMVMRERDRKK
ncbi:hypothetical protein DES53_11727 [Roseimicrobium gellanilyticum]|uniref:Uncharacterized protein n=1 Tax=Roseimicrobium gellanilyticum TaxID=748857 RepID=A0A366H306_9BACT|nr:hypothetical protein [Roseimicrobium gellanilyticum]RBP36338.1 hypothetical protein DES53_11727 [Roseimicrobium gellanilyticum]